MPFDFKGPRRVGAFSRALTIFLTPQCRGFSRALISEKSKSPLFPGSWGGGGGGRGYKLFVCLFNDASTLMGH